VESYFHELQIGTTYFTSQQVSLKSKADGAPFFRRHLTAFHIQVSFKSSLVGLSQVYFKTTSKYRATFDRFLIYCSRTPELDE
jgi:hypothetical protein